jgi:plastocyanin
MWHTGNTREFLMIVDKLYSMHVRSGPLTLLLGVFLVVAALVFVAGCTDTSSSKTPPPTPVYSPKTTILIGSASVNPQILVIDKGVTVTWINTDIGNHIVTSDTGTPDAFTSPLLVTNHRYQFSFTIPGTYTYHCADNAAIKGTIIVNK